MTGNKATRFQVLAETVSDMVWIHALDGAWTYANTRWCDYTGLTTQESTGFGWRRAVHREDWPRIRAQWQAAIREGGSFTLACRLRGVDNCYREFLVRAVPLDQLQWLATATALASAETADAPLHQNGPDQQRPMPAVFSQTKAKGPEVATSDDVDAAAMAENLRETEGRWQFALEAADMGVWEWDLNTGIGSRSLRHDQIFGYDTLLPEWTYDFFLQHVVDQDREALDRQVQRTLAEGGDGLFECRITRADGETRWIRISGRVSHNSEGQAVRMWGIIEDTTERKLAEQALRDREAHFRSLANTAPAMLWVSNVDHMCSFISRGWCQFTGQTTAEALGRGWVNPIHPDDRERAERNFVNAARKRNPFQIEFRLRTVKGLYRWALNAGRPRFAANGDFLGYVGSITDVHDMRMAREGQQRMGELLNAVIDTTQDSIYVKDLHGRMQLANPAALRAIGKPAEEVLGHSDLEWLDNPEEGARIEANDMRIMECGRTEVVEEWMSTAEGSRLFVATKSPLRNEQGEVIGLVGISRDVTEQKRAEQQVIESESRMRRLFDNAPAHIAIFKGARHNCVYVNRAYGQFVGERDMLGLAVAEAFPELEHQGAIERLDRVFQTGQALVTPQVETFYRTSDCGASGYGTSGYSTSGKTLTGIFHETIQPWLHEDGTVAGVMVMAFDITAEVELRRRVEESEARFRALADNIAQLAWMADERGRIFWYNRRWLDYTGTTFKDMQNSRWENVHHPDHAQRVIKKVGHCLKTGEALEDTFPLRGGDGQYRWFYSQAIPIRDESGRVIRWFGTHTDITEQREATRALEEADRRKNEFLAMLAHELRNPLAPVRYAVEILRNMGSSEEVQARARDTINRQVAHMARLIDDLLDVSRITRGKIELRKEHCDLSSIVRKTVAEYRLSIEATEVALSCSVPAEPIWIDGDPTRLVQAIGNLLHNAGKFTEPGGRVTVDLRREPATGAAVLTIADTGVGIERDLLIQLFEPFSQAAQTLDRCKGGLGLGLSLVKGLVELHGGAVAAASDGPGCGSTFTLRLPTLTSAIMVAEKPPQPFVRMKSSELRVLIIEDNRDTAESLGTLLEMAGHRVDVAYDGPSGVEMAKQTLPDVVLCDVGLPGGMDGYQVVRSLREELMPDEPHLFALSGYGQESDRRLAREAGFERHFVKPVDYAELSEALAMASSHRRECHRQC